MHLKWPSFLYKLTTMSHGSLTLCWSSHWFSPIINSDLWADVSLHQSHSPAVLFVTAAHLIRIIKGISEKIFTVNQAQSQDPTWPWWQPSSCNSCTVTQERESAWVKRRAGLRSQRDHFTGQGRGCRRRRRGCSHGGASSRTVQQRHFQTFWMRSSPRGNCLCVTHTKWFHLCDFVLF